MMKLVVFVTRLEGTTHEEFEDYWRDRHAPLVRSHAWAVKLRRYVQVHARHPGIVESLRSRDEAGNGLEARYDGVVEAYWDSAEEFAESFATEEGKAAWAEIAADERKFSDIKRSRSFVGEEIEILPLPAPAHSG
jgi:uncharacterized protein (TIGR02118 family)